jgi:hypothetical protein
VLKTIMAERFSRLPEPSDAWMPRYSELGEVASPVLAEAPVEGAAHQELNIFAPASQYTAALA